MHMSLLLLLAAQGAVYLNGVPADGLRNQEFKNVDVRVDAEGDIWIEGKHYKVKVRAAEEHPPEPEAPPEPAATEVSRGLYWLVTQDNESVGHEVQVSVNGEVVGRVSSGQDQIILDLAPWLKKGDNEVLMSALPGPEPDGGALFIFVGAGSNESGVVRLKDPDIAFSRRSTDSPTGSTGRYVLAIP